MEARKICIFVLLLLVLPFSIAEIELSSADPHTFIVNKYYVSSPRQEELPRIMIQHIVSEATINPCESTNLSFMITNPSNNPSVYTFTVTDFEGLGYITQDLYLSPKQSKIIQYILIPDCSLHGTLNPKILISSGDEEAKIPLILHINDAYGFSLEIEDTLLVCNNIVTRVPVKLSNLADFQNNYTLRVNKDWIQPEYGYMVIDNKSEGYFDLIITPNFPTDSTTLAQIEVLPQYGDPATYKFNVNTQNCYAQEFKLKDNNICETDNLYVILKNKGIYNQSFDLLSESAFYFDQTELNLDPEDDITIPVYYDLDPGKYDILLKSYIKGTSIFEEIQDKINIVSLNDCYKPELLTKSTKVTHGMDTSILEIKSSPYQDDEYDLELEAPDWAYLEDDELFLEKGTTNIITVLTDIPEEIKQASYEASLILRSKSSDNVYVEHFNIRLADYTLVEYLLVNQCLIIFGIFLLIALIFFIKFVIDVGTSKKKARIDLVVVFMILILAFILTIVCFDSFKTKLNLKYHPIDESENQCTTYFSKSICESRYYIRINEDSSYQIDLSDLFYDPDGDILEYEVLNAQNIRVVVQNGILTLIPNRDWYGVEEITFIARDGKGGFAESRNFFIHVINKQEFNIQDFVLDYHVFISLSVILLLFLLTAVLVYGLISDKENEQHK